MPGVDSTGLPREPPTSVTRLVNLELTLARRPGSMLVPRPDRVTTAAGYRPRRATPRTRSRESIDSRGDRALPARGGARTGSHEPGCERLASRASDERCGRNGAVSDVTPRRLLWTTRGRLGRR